MTAIPAHFTDALLPEAAAPGAHNHPPVNGTPTREGAPAKGHDSAPGDVVELSPQAIEAATATESGAETANEQSSNTGQGNAESDTTGTNEENQEQDQDPSEPRSITGEKLTEEEQKQVEELKARDREVRRHEAAHKAAAGQYATGGPTYTYQRGPDGKQYAVGGEVQIDTSPIEGDPAATIRKMGTIRRAALAPTEPSSQDRAVAADAAQKAQKARQELREQKAEETNPTSQADGTTDTPATEQAQPTDESAGTDTPSSHRHTEAEEAFNKTNELAGQLVDTLA